MESNTITLENTLDRPAVVSARDPETGAVGFRTIPANGSAEFLYAEGVAIAQTRDYLKATAHAAGEVIEPAIEGVRLGEFAGHATVAASDGMPAGTSPEIVTIVDDREQTAAGASFQGDGDGTSSDPADTGQPAGTYDPSTGTVEAVNAYLATASDAERARVLEAERTGKNRAGIVGAS